MICGTTTDVINAIAKTMMTINGIKEEEKPLVKGKDYIFVADDSFCVDLFVEENYADLEKQGLKEEADIILKCYNNLDSVESTLMIRDCWDRIFDNLLYKDKYYLTYHGRNGEDLYAVKLDKALPDFWDCEEDFWEN